MTTTQQPKLHSVDDHHARFEAGADTVDNGTTPPPTGTDGPGRNTSKARAAHPLPSDRIKFDTQLEVLRSVAIVSGNNRRGSTAEAMSAAVGLKGGTGGLNSKFFEAAGWFERTGRGEYTASPGALAWNQHTTVMPDEQYQATAAMRDEVKGSWFWQAVEPVLSSGHPVKRELLLLQLSRAAGTSSHGEQLAMILTWLDWVGLVGVGDDGKIALNVAARVDDPPADEPLVRDADAVTDTVVGDAPHAGALPEEEQAEVQAPASASPTAAVDTDAIVSFNMSIRLTADDVERMSDEQRDFVLALADKLRG